MNAEVLAFVLYFVLMLAIGVLFFFKEKGAGEKEYFLGGRHMGPWVTAMSAQASDMSAWLLMGLPGLAYFTVGFGQIWIGIGLAIGTIANWIIVARRLRCFSEAANDSITLPQYLSNRFATKSLTLQIICAVIFLVCFTIYVASAFVSGATVFTTVFPSLSNQTAMLIFAAIMILYTFLGGFKAVCWTDFFQGLLMLVAVLAIPIMIVATEQLDTGLLSKVIVGNDGTEYAFGSSLFTASWKDIASGLAWGLGYFGMPHIIVRFMSIEKASMVKKSATVAIIWVILSLGSVCLIAYFGRMLVAEELLANGMQKTIFITLARRLFPAFIAGVLLAAIMAASMSTADSQMLAAASSVSQNILQEFGHLKLSEKQSLFAARLTIICVSVVGVVLARDPDSSVFGIVSFAWAGFGGSFGAVVLCALFWKRCNWQGALAGMLCGGLMVFVWKYIVSPLGGVFGIYELLPAFLVSLAVCAVVSLVTPAPTEDILAEFDAAK